MPIAAPRPCSHTGCRVLATAGGRCADHQREVWIKRPAETKRIGGRKRKALRAALFAREPLCAECRVVLAEERDHIVPLGEGGKEDDSNTQGLCIPCHEVKSAAERLRARRRA